MALGSIIAGALAPVVVEKIADGIKYRQDKRNTRRSVSTTKKTTAPKKKPAPKPAKFQQVKKQAQKKRKENIKKKQIGKVSKKKIDFI